MKIGRGDTTCVYSGDVTEKCNSGDGLGGEKWQRLASVVRSVLEIEQRSTGIAASDALQCCGAAGKGSGANP